MEISEAIDRALPVFVQHKASHEEVLAEALIETGIPEPLAYLAIEFMPLAFGRVYLTDLGVATKEEYVRYVIEDGNIIEKERKQLVDEPFYAASLGLAHSMIDQGKPGDEYMAVAGRSAELEAVIDLVNNGSKAENIVLTPPHIPFRSAS